MVPKAILFDLDDTILGSELGDSLKLWKFCVDQHIDQFKGLKSENLYKEIRRVARAFWSDPVRHRRGRLKMRQTRQHLVAQAARNLDCPNDEAAHNLGAYYHERREGKTKPFPGAIETLIHFHRSPIKTALITNGESKNQRRKINDHELSQYFDIIIVEEEFGQGKPEPQVYHHVSQELGVEPGDSWIVGDNLEWEVRVPQSLGYYAIWNDHKGVGISTESKITPNRTVQSIYELME